MIAYAEGVLHGPADEAKFERALDLVTRLFASDEQPVVAVQVLAELHHVLRRRLQIGPDESARMVARWREACLVVPSTPQVFDDAQALATEHKLQIYDALILASVAGSADLLLSEDMQHGFVWRGVRVVDPFAAGFSLGGGPE